MAKYLVVYSYQDEAQPLLRLKYIVQELYRELVISDEELERSNFVVENLIKLGD